MGEKWVMKIVHFKTGPIDMVLHPTPIIHVREVVTPYNLQVTSISIRKGRSTWHDLFLLHKMINIIYMSFTIMINVNS